MPMHSSATGDSWGGMGMGGISLYGVVAMENLMAIWL